MADRMRQIEEELALEREARHVAEAAKLKHDTKVAQNKAGREQREADGTWTVDDLFWTKSDDDTSSDDNSL
jgi:hypothetical protein